MNVTFFGIFLLFWFEKVVIGQKFKNKACKGPDIGIRLIFGFDNGFRSSIFSRLYVISELFVLPAGVTEVNNFNF